jgi:glycosyltransferase involved in cell wall biosynthesis
MADKPYISIVTPALNMEASIARTLRSLEGQRASYEHVVLDGGSKDRTHEIVRSFADRYPVRLQVEENAGVYGNVVKGFRHTSGEVMGWVAGDDFYFPWTLAVVQHIFQTRPDIEWITGIPSMYYESSGLCTTARVAKYHPRAFLKRGWHRAGMFGFLEQESIFWRRSLWDRSNAEEVMLKYRYAGDFQLWKRFAEHTSLHTVASVLACFTVRSNQFSASKELEYFKECGCTKVRYNVHPLCNLISFLLTGIFRNRVLVVQTRKEGQATPPAGPAAK